MFAEIDIKVNITYFAYPNIILSSVIMYLYINYI